MTLELVDNNVCLWRDLRDQVPVFMQFVYFKEKGKSSKKCFVGKRFGELYFLKIYPETGNLGKVNKKLEQGEILWKPYIYLTQKHLKIKQLMDAEYKSCKNIQKSN